MTRAWVRSAIMIAAGVAFAVGLTSPAAYSRAKKKEPTPTETPTPTPTATPEVKVWNFDQDKAHTVASGWTAVEGDWEVIPDPSAPSQPNTYGLPPGRTISSLMHGLSYNLITVVTDPTEYGDFTLEASFKSAPGYRFDCSGGLIFRYVNAQNFYLLSAGCPNDFFGLSRMTNGKLENLKQQVVPTDKDTWYKLKVWAQGSHFTCYDDNKMIFDIDDAKIAKGRIGLWANDDSQARFDDVTLTLPLATAGGGAPAEAAPPPPPPPPPSH